MPSRPYWLASRTSSVASVGTQQTTAQADPWAILAAQRGFAESMRRSLKQLGRAKASFGSGGRRIAAERWQSDEVERFLAACTPELRIKLEAAISRIVADPSAGPLRPLAPEWKEWRDCIVDASAVEGDSHYYIVFMHVLAGEEFWVCLLAIFPVQTRAATTVPASEA